MRICEVADGDLLRRFVGIPSSGIVLGVVEAGECEAIDVGSEDSVLVRGKGKARAGGMGRMLARGFCWTDESVVDVNFAMAGELRGYVNERRIGE